MISGGIAPGWYPDYDAPPGHQRYWDGERWTERRASAPEPPPPASHLEGQVRRYAPWVLGVVGVLGVISAAVLVVGGDDPATSSTPAATPPPSSTPGPPASEATASPDDDPSEPGSAGRTWLVSAAVDGATLRLDNGAEVRLLGVGESCGSLELAKLVVGQDVVLTRGGPDKDSGGRLLRYVDDEGVDVGKRLIQRGLATASDDANPRRAIYRRIDERSPDVC